MYFSKFQYLLYCYFFFSEIKNKRYNDQCIPMFTTYLYIYIYTYFRGLNGIALKLSYSIERYTHFIRLITLFLEYFYFLWQYKMAVISHLLIFYRLKFYWRRYIHLCYTWYKVPILQDDLSVSTLSATYSVWFLLL